MWGIIACMLLFSSPFISSASVYLYDFWWPLTRPGWYGDESAFMIDWVSDTNSFIENVRRIFWPDYDIWWGRLWEMLRMLAIWLLIIMFVWAWAYLMFYGSNPDNLNKWLRNLLYLIVWAVILYLALRLLWSWLDFWWFSWLSWSDGDSILEKWEQNILLVMLGILKWIWFFAALVFIIYYGYQMMTAFDAEEKQKAAKQWIINVLLALVFIKVIDYIYFITLQTTFRNDAIALIVEFSKWLWLILWIFMIIVMIYAWYLMITANGDDEQVKKWKNLVISVFIAILVLMLFLLIIYQVVHDVVW